MSDDINPVAWMHDFFVSTNRERVEYDEMKNRQCGFKAKPVHALYLGEDVSRLLSGNERLRALLREVLETYGKSWQEWCEECGGLNKHRESCLLGRIEEALK